MDETVGPVWTGRCAFVRNVLWHA